MISTVLREIIKDEVYQLIVFADRFRNLGLRDSDRVNLQARGPLGQVELQRALQVLVDLKSR